jgi:hypothetical protein
MQTHHAHKRRKHLVCLCVCVCAYMHRDIDPDGTDGGMLRIQVDEADQALLARLRRAQERFEKLAAAHRPVYGDRAVNRAVGHTDGPALAPASPRSPVPVSP